MSLIKCTCKHDFQDKVYGSGNRVWTPITKSYINGVLKSVRCTVCGKEHPAPKK